MDPANRKASTGLLALGQNMHTKEESSVRSSPTTSTTEPPDGSFEMMEAQQCDDALPDIEEENVDVLWEEVDIDNH